MIFWPIFKQVCGTPPGLPGDSAVFCCECHSPRWAPALSESAPGRPVRDLSGFFSAFPFWLLLSNPIWLWKKSFPAFLLWQEKSLFREDLTVMSCCLLSNLEAPNWIFYWQCRYSELCFKRPNINLYTWRTTFMERLLWKKWEVTLIWAPYLSQKLFSFSNSEIGAEIPGEEGQCNWPV